MNIIFIVNHFYPELGAIRTEFEIANKLSESSNVLVVTTFPRKYRLPENTMYDYPKIKPAVIEHIYNLKVLRINSFKSHTDNIRQRFIELLTSTIFLLLASFFLVPFNKVILIAGDIELVVSQVGIILGKIWRKPVVVILHDIHPDTLIKSGVIKNRVIIVLSELLIRMFSKHVDVVVVHSHTNAFILSKRYNISAKRIRVIELWANTDEIKPVSIREKRDLKLKHIRDGDKFIVSFAGVMNPPQGLDVVIYAAHIIKHHYNSDKILFLLVGDGMDRQRLQQLAEELNVRDIVEFLPLQPRDKYIEILQLSDACLVTLRKDYLQPVVPSKLLEIMAAGCPAVLSMPAHSDAVSIVKKYKCGLYAGSGDPWRLAKVIMKLYYDDELRAELSHNGRRAAVSYYNLDRALKEYKGVLQELVK